MDHSSEFGCWESDAFAIICTGSGVGCITGLRMACILVRASSTTCVPWTITHAPWRNISSCLKRYQILRPPPNSGNQGLVIRDLDNELPFFQSRKFGKTPQKSGKIWQWPRRERFSPVWRMCVLCHVSKLCPLTDWLAMVAFYGLCSVNITHLSRQ